MKFRSLVSAAALLAAVGISSSAQADIVFIEQVNVGGGLTTIDVDSADVFGSVAFGDFSGNDNRFRIETDAAIAAGAQGQISFQVADADTVFTTATITSPGFTFDPLVLRVRTDEAFTVSARDDQGTLFTSQVSYSPTGGGFSSFIIVDAINGQSISSVTITGAFTAVQQLRADNVTVVPGPIAGAGLPALMALGGFVWARRRKATATA